MKDKLTIYASYGVLAHEKLPVYTVSRPASDIYDTYTAILPEGWKTAENDAGELLIEAPDGTLHLANQLISNDGDKCVLRWYEGLAKRTVPVEFVNKIKAARLAAGLTQIQLAEAVGCTQKDISRWESGKHEPSISTLKRIAQALKCSMDDLA